MAFRKVNQQEVTSSDSGSTVAAIKYRCPSTRVSPGSIVDRHSWRECPDGGRPPSGRPSRPAPARRPPPGTWPKYADGLAPERYRPRALEYRGRNKTVGFHLEPRADRILHEIRAGGRAVADKTLLPSSVHRTRRRGAPSFAAIRVSVLLISGELLHSPRSVREE